MEVKAKKLEEVIVDILCDVCHQATAFDVVPLIRPLNLVL